MLNVGPSGLPFAPYEGQKASKLGRSRNEGIPEIHHQSDARIEAHIFVAFLAYGLMVTLKQRLKALAPGLTPRAVLELFPAPASREFVGDRTN